MTQETQNAPNQTVLIVLSIFLPFVAVWLASQGNPKQNMRSTVAFVGSRLFAIPGIVYALDIVLDKKMIYPKIDEMI